MPAHKPNIPPTPGPIVEVRPLWEMRTVPCRAFADVWRNDMA